MTQKDRPTDSTPEYTELPSAVDRYLVSHGLGTLAQLGEIPIKPGKATQHDQKVRVRVDELVYAIRALVEDLLTAESRTASQDERHVSLLRRFQDAQATIGLAAGAAKLAWLLGSILRNCGGVPVIYSYEEDSAPRGSTPRMVRTYNLSFIHCGVTVVYHPWKECGEEMQVTLNGEVTRRFAVHTDGTLSAKEEEALVGFLLKHSIKAEFPPEPSSEQAAAIPGMSALAEALVGLDPSQVMVIHLGDHDRPHPM